MPTGRQSADKAHKRKNRSDRIEIRDDFCFLRQLHLHPAVTYVYVSSLGCKHSFLVLWAFSTLCQSVDFVNILAARGTICPRAVFIVRRGRFPPPHALVCQAMRSAESVAEALAAVSAILSAAELVRRTDVFAPATSSA